MSDQGVTPLTGCGCGQVHLPSKQDTWVDGRLHRYCKPCYAVGENGERVYLDMKAYVSLPDRVANLERVVAELVAKGEPRSP